MKRIFDFGTVFYPGFGRCKMTVSVELTPKKEGEVLSICGDLYSSEIDDSVMGGQCLEELAELSKQFGPNKKAFFDKLFNWWKLYHLNDMNPGTPDQEKALKDKDPKLTFAANYDEAVKYLKSIGLYEVPFGDKTYKYGHGWLFRPIPAEILKEIKELLK